MTINFRPDSGVILVCNFDTGFQPPEMVKCRPVVVISPQRRNDQTCIVVPLSSTAPDAPMDWHHQLEAHSLPSGLRKGGAIWAKCDMVTSVANWRLDRVKDGRDGSGKRLYVAQRVTLADLIAIRKGVLVALGLGGLREHLTTTGLAP